jgi:hypothetical protein
MYTHSKREREREKYMFDINLYLLFQVDLMGGLNKIEANVRAGVYLNDYDLHADLLRLFNQLYDAHTWFGMPNGYANCLILRPFNLRAHQRNSKMVVTLEEGSNKPKKRSNIYIY